LKRELGFVDPQMAVALGATAALALACHRVTIAKARGPADFDGCPGFVAVHASNLFASDKEARKIAYEAFIADLRAIAGST
jgi:uracil-DNA glycosylase